MANHIYPLAKKQMLLGGIDLSSVNVKALLVNVSGAGHALYIQRLARVPERHPVCGARIATSANLSGKAIGNDGSFNSDDPTFSGVTGDSVEAIVLYIDTGAEGSLAPDHVPGHRRHGSAAHA